MRVEWKSSAGESFSAAIESIELVKDLDEERYEILIDSNGTPVREISVLPEYGEYPFQLLSIQVDLDGPGGTEMLRRVAPGSEDLGVVSFDGIRLFQVNGFTYFLAETDDARMGLKLEGHELGARDHYRVAVRLIRLDASYAASFRTHFLGELKKAESRIRALEDRLEELSKARSEAEELRRELRIIRSSRIWRAAEAARKVVYGGWLRRHPKLQRRLLGASRERVRKSLADQAGPSLGALESNRIDHNPRRDAYDELVDYWESHRLSDEAIAGAITDFSSKPLISLVMPVHNTPAQWLQEAIDSVIAQRYDNFELCICDDASSLAETLGVLESIEHPRIRMTRLKEGRGISEATNRAIEISSGSHIAFLDHDDCLDRDALFHVCEAINQMDPDVLYTDEDYIDTQGHRVRPNFKPDFSPDLLLSHNYITHLLVVRRELLDETGHLDSNYDGAQDYDLVLRLSERAGTISHIPRVLYHWRQSAVSSSLDAASKPYIQERTRQLLKHTMERRGTPADILDANIPHFFYTRRKLEDRPSVSILIPFRDQPALLEKCVNSILKRTTYSEYEIVGINNQSASPITFELMQAYRANPRIRFVDYDEAFNFSALVNCGAHNARGDYLVLMNNDIEIITWQWIEEMLCQAANEGTGAVGGKLFYPDNTVQHAGIVVGIAGYAGHGHKRFACHAQGYANRLQLVQNVSAVTGAFMMVRKDLFERVGGFDEETFPVACNDVDFCLRLIDEGYWNVFTPYAQAYHLESASRGYEVTEEKRKRFEREKSVFRERHASMLELGDPFYNPNLGLDNESFMIRVPRAGATE